MKARVYKNIPESERNRLKKDMETLALKEFDNLKDRVVRRTEKIDLIALVLAFGFGPVRLERFIKEREKIRQGYGDDPIFWEHIDRVLIDNKGLDLERDYTD